MNRTYLSLATVIFVSVTLFMSPVFAQHFPEPIPTDGNMSILVSATDINGVPASPGDEVATFDPQGVCAGRAIFENDDQVGIGAWRDDPASEVDEGFRDNDPIEYRIWDADQDVEMIADPPGGDEANRRWANNGFVVVTLHADGIGIPRIREVEHDFGVLDMTVGEARNWSTTIENLGNSDVSILEVGGDADAWLFGPRLEDDVIPVDDSIAFFSVFPGGDYQVGTDYSSVITLATDCPDSLIEIHLTGRIGAPRYEMDKDSIDFGVVNIPSDLYPGPGFALDSILIRNPGDATLNVFNLQCSQAAFSLAGGNPAEFSLHPGDSAYIRVEFRPEEHTEYNGTMVYATNAVTRPTHVTIPLHGEGLNPISVGEDRSQPPMQFSLSPVYPNPFNGKATVRFTVPSNSHTRLVVYDVRGSEVLRLADETLTSGEHSVTIESHGLPAGSYLLRLTNSGNLAESHFVVLK